MSINTLDIFMGIHSEQSPAFSGKNSANNKIRPFLNGLNILGWLPIAGIISGVARLVFTAIMYRNEKSSSTPEIKAFYTVMFLRGAVESLSLGFLLLVPDLLFTIGRKIAHSSSNDNHMNGHASYNFYVKSSELHYY